MRMEKSITRNITLAIIGMLMSAITAQADIDAGKEAYFMGDYERAIEAFMPDAETGNTYAQIKIGFMYENGWGVEKSYVSAVNWYQRAIDGKDPEGSVAMAKLHAYGRGLPRDYSRVEALILDAAEKGYHHAYYVMGDFHNDANAFGFNTRQALDYYLRAAEKKAAANLVNGHYRVGKGQWFRLITARGVQATRRLADEGNMYAQFNTGLRYYFGEGVSKNHMTANSYFLMAALSGNVEAQKYLAQNRVMEDPVGYDRVFVHKWFSIAAASGSKEAERSKSAMETDMTAEQIAQSKSEADEWLASR
jgi:TPR repeat protein